MSEIFGGISLLIGLIIGISIYFIPAIIAFKRQKANKIAILALNFLAGWTFIGWVLSFVWSLTKDNTNVSQ